MPAPRDKPGTQRVVAVNRRARHDYELLESYEAGLILNGSEVKALREGKGQLVDAYALVGEHGVVVKNLEIARYSHDQLSVESSRRTRGLLLRKAELVKLRSRLREKGLVLVPLSIYFKGPWAKLELAVGKGRRKGDKRQEMRRQDAERDMDRAYRHR